VKGQKSLFYSWGKPGIQLYHRVTGTDNEGIESKGERKSIGISRTFDAIDDSQEIKRRIMIMARHIVYMVMAIEVNPTTYYLKVNYEYGIKVKKSETVNRLFSETLFKQILSEMYKSMLHPSKGAIKLSVNVSNFTSQHQKTLSLLDLHEDMSEQKLSVEIQKLRERFGLDIIKTAGEL
jgi:DNA polymerase-4